MTKNTPEDLLNHQLEELFMKKIILHTIIIGFFLPLSLQGYKKEKNQVKVTSGTTEFSSVGYERSFFRALDGQQSAWAHYTIPQSTSYKGSDLKIDGYSFGARHYFSQKKAMSGFFIGAGYFNQTIAFSSNNTDGGALSGKIDSATISTGVALPYKSLRIDLSLSSFISNKVDFRGQPYGDITKTSINKKIGRNLGHRVKNGDLKIPFSFKFSLGFVF